MTQGEPIGPEDATLLRSLSTSDRKLGLRDREKLARLASAVAEIATLPEDQRGNRCREVITKPEVDLVRASVERVRRAASAAPEPGRLDALVVKLAACLPARNGG
jgi:hypothetical protein